MLRKLFSGGGKRRGNKTAAPPVPAEWKRILDEAAERIGEPALDSDAQGFALPPWKAIPDIPRYSIGWRMGGGEDYWVRFHDWYRDLPQQERERYRAAYPEPDEWLGFYAERE